MMNKLSDTFALNNGYAIPCVGFGTWQTPDGDTAVAAMKEAILTGYRHIDAAACYNNEQGVGEGIRQGLAAAGLSREELFVTSKVWNTERGYRRTLAAFDKTLSDLGLDYLDLYLIHWPANSLQFPNWEELNADTWRAMTELYQAGKVKAIGVSNFMPHHLRALMATSVPPMVNQIEYHPGTMWKDTVDFCQQNGIVVEGWSPLGCGRVLGDERLAAIAARYGKSVAQVCLRWALQNGVLPLPKSVQPARIRENAAVFDFALSQEDMALINGLPEFGGSGLHPDQVTF